MAGNRFQVDLENRTIIFYSINKVKEIPGFWNCEENISISAAKGKEGMEKQLWRESKKDFGGVGKGVV